MVGQSSPFPEYISLATMFPIVFRPCLELLPVVRNSVVAAQPGAAKAIWHRKIWPPSGTPRRMHSERLRIMPFNRRSWKHVPYDVRLNGSALRKAMQSYMHG